MDRRKFFENSGRWLLATAIGAVSGFMVIQRDIASGSSCTENKWCGSCLKSDNCEKPQALKQLKGEKR